MGFITSVSILYCLVVFLPSVQCIRRPFWRKPKPTLPPLSANPQYYEKLQVIPPKEETVKKVITNILRIRPGGIGKRQVFIEDTVIVMDGSGSVGSCEFRKGREAMQHFADYTKATVDAKYAMVTFSDDARRDFGFLPQAVAAIKIRSVGYPGGSTNTQAGIAEALDLFNKGGRYGSNFVILLTDGKSNVKPQNTIPNAQKLKNRGVTIFVVAVGDLSLDGISEMAHIASKPVEKTCFVCKKLETF